MCNYQPIEARSLDFGLRHLGWLVRVDHATRCAVCAQTIAGGAQGIEAPGGSVSHRACGELLRLGDG